MRPLLAAFVLLLVTSPAALGFCATSPDDATTGYTANATAHALCLQNELQHRARQAAEAARLEAELGNIRIELERSRRMLMLRLPQPAFVAPPI